MSSRKLTFCSAPRIGGGGRGGGDGLGGEGGEGSGGGDGGDNISHVGTPTWYWLALTKGKLLVALA
ncbi:MAG: hypothetical protein CMD92_08050 [Gammaproteobacteria bacterium]|nr:hypothetical protein [Gammaproteobacteria bacterium]